MKKHFIVFITLLTAMMAILLNGCATTPKVEMVDNSIGTWDYIISGTPVGDLGGILVIGKEGENYTGSMEGDYLSGPLEGVAVENDNFTATTYYSGTPLQITGAFEGSSFSGALSADVGNFSMTAQKRQ